MMLLQSWTDLNLLQQRSMNGVRLVFLVRINRIYHFTISYSACLRHRLDALGNTRMQCPRVDAFKGNSF